jgi:hypothetical protein
MRQADDRLRHSMRTPTAIAPITNPIRSANKKKRGSHRGGRMSTLEDCRLGTRDGAATLNARYAVLTRWPRLLRCGSGGDNWD